MILDEWKRAAASVPEQLQWQCVGVSVAIPTPRSRMITVFANKPVQIVCTELCIANGIGSYCLLPIPNPHAVPSVACTGTVAVSHWYLLVVVWTEDLLGTAVDASCVTFFQFFSPAGWGTARMKMWLSVSMTTFLLL
jgi:hypothetical protein